MSTVIATVTTVTNDVVIQAEDGSTRIAVVGEQLSAGEKIITPEGGEATLLVDGQDILNIPANQVLQLTPDILASQEPAPDERQVDEIAADDILDIIDGEGDLLDELGETAAGAGEDAGPDGEGSSIVRLIRISETITPVSYNYAPLSGDDDTIVEPDADAVPPQPVVITLSVESLVTEGGTYTVVANLSSPVTGGPFVIQLNDGSIITIPVGSSTGEVAVPVREDDVYVQNDDIVNINIDSTSGGNFSTVDSSSSVTVIVTDDNDVTVITLTSPNTVVEGNTITVTATVSNPVTDSPLVITLNNGNTIIIPVGATSGTAELSTREDDLLIQGDEPLSFAISTVSGGNFEALDSSSTATTTVTDDNDVTTITLSAPAQVVEGQPITVTATVSNAVTGSPLVIDLGNGNTITIPVGATSGQVTVDSRADDAYVQGTESLNFAVVGTSGGNFEALNSVGTSTQVVDDADVTTITLSAPAQVVEGQPITVTATVSNAVTGTPLVIDLGNGRTITIPVGATSGQVTVDSRADDAYVQGTESLDFAVVGTSGGNFEALDTTSTASSTIVDDADVTTITLSAPTQVVEGQPITVTATVSNAVTGSPLVIDLGNGNTITIPVGATSGTTSVDSRADDVYTQGAQSVSFAVVGTSGGNFEALDTTSTASSTIVDDADVTTITLSAPTQVVEGQPITVTATVSNAVTGTSLVIDLGNGRTITIPVGATSGELTVESRADDAYVQGTQSLNFAVVGTSGGNFEALNSVGTSTQVVDDADVTTITLSAPAQVVEGQPITVTATVSNAVTGTPLVIDLGNGLSITIPVGATSGELTVESRADDAYVQGTQSLNFAVVGTSGGNFEALNSVGTSTQVVDDADVTIITLSGPEGVTEGGLITLTANVDNAPQDTPLVITLTNGAQITIAVGETSGSVSFDSREDDIYLQGDERIIVGIAETTGGNYESLDTSDQISFGIMDDSDETVLTLGNAEYLEGSTGVITATLSAAPLTTLTVTLSNGATITFTPDYVPGTAVESTPFDIPVTTHGEPGSATDSNVELVVTVDDYTGGQFENLVFVDGSLTITDDVPTLTVGEPLTVVSGGTSEASVAGSLAYDFGADGAGSLTVNGDEFMVPTVGQPTVISGNNGVLTLNADGSYRYQANANSGGTSDSFVFVIRDADGDEVTQTLSVRITQPDDPSGELVVTVNEAGLGDAQDVSDSAVITIPTGFTYDSIVSQGQFGTVALVNGQLVYTLSTAVAHAEGNGTNTALNADRVTLLLKDANNNTFEVNVAVNVVDDVPTLTVGEPLTVVSGGTSEASAVGSLAYDFGADGAGSLTVNGDEFMVPTVGQPTVISGNNGVLTLNADGSYRYQANANSGGTSDSFVFVIRDADGDEVTQTLSVRITQPDDPSGELVVTVNEAGLGDAQDDSESAVITIPTGFTYDSIVSQGQFGTVALVNGQLVYTLSTAVAHAEGNGTNTALNADRVTLLLKDANNNTFEVNVAVNVVDDVPTLTVGEPLTVVSGGTSEASAVGSLAYDFGADGAGSLTVNGDEFMVPTVGQPTVISGNNGVLTLNADGSYRYQANANSGGTSDSFVFVIRDADGDEVTQTLSVRITQPDDPSGELVVTVNEAGLGDAQDDSESAVITIPTGFTYDSIVSQGQFGTVALVNGQLVYTLSTAVAHAEGNGTNTALNADRVTLLLKDANNNTFEVNVAVNVVDDVPTLTVGEPLTVVSGGTSEASAVGSLAYDFGADGAGSLTVNGDEFMVPTVGQPTVISGNNGVLTLNADGSYRYQANANSGGTSDSFVFVIRDADGDEVTQTLSVRITQPDDPSGELVVTVNEAGLGDAQDDSESAVITIPTGFTYDSIVSQGQFGTVALVNGQLVYTLSTAVAHAEGNGTNTALNADRVTLLLKDANNNTFEVNVAVNVVDDVPTLTVGEPLTVVSGGTSEASAVGSLAYDFGADGAGSLTVNGDEFMVPTVGQPTVISGNNGVLTLNADGSYRYQANANSGGTSDSFVFVIRDADGDEVTQTLSVRITQPDDPSGELVVTVNEAGLGDAQDDSESAVITIPTGFTYDSIVSQGQFGTVALVNGQLVYTLSTAVAHAEGNGTNTALNATV
ncbi:retention module-containing protein [Alishewanella sp. d11]|uniref:retention module-containing protein n=1 Tax=Alishewanella sp. d11 TaxID=3414030 RepID=UPI003BF8DFA5